MRESVIEKYLVEQVEMYGGMCEKFRSPQQKNVPDRICSWPGFLGGRGTVDFVELKATGKFATVAQARDHERRRKIGQQVFVINSKAAVDWYIASARSRA